jgi:hypothetical protein
MPKQCSISRVETEAESGRAGPSALQQARSQVAKLWRKIVKPFRASVDASGGQGAALLVNERIITLSWASRSSPSNRREGSDHTEVLEMSDVRQLAAKSKCRLS